MVVGNHDRFEQAVVHSGLFYRATTGGAILLVAVPVSEITIEYKLVYPENTTDKEIRAEFMNLQDLETQEFGQNKLVTLTLSDKFIPGSRITTHIEQYESGRILQILDIPPELHEEWDG